MKPTTNFTDIAAHFPSLIEADAPAIALSNLLRDKGVTHIEVAGAISGAGFAKTSTGYGVRMAVDVQYRNADELTQAEALLQQLPGFCKITRLQSYVEPTPRLFRGVKAESMSLNVVLDTAAYPGFVMGNLWFDIVRPQVDSEWPGDDPQSLKSLFETTFPALSWDAYQAMLPLHDFQPGDYDRFVTLMLPYSRRSAEMPAEPTL